MILSIVFWNGRFPNESQRFRTATSILDMFCSAIGEELKNPIGNIEVYPTLRTGIQSALDFITPTITDYDTFIEEDWDKLTPINI